jgi:hypothetical protein
VLFPVGVSDTQLAHQEWLTATRKTRDEWVIAAKQAQIKLKPFMAIADETYRLYSRLREA